MVEEKGTEKKENIEDKPSVNKEISNKKPITHKLRENPWMLSTIVLAVFVVVLFFGSTNLGTADKVIGSEEIGSELLSYYESNGITGLELDSVKELSGVYQVNFNYQGQIVPIFATKDGQYVGSMSLLETGTDVAESSGSETTEIPQTETPLSQLYIWSYCPYGVTALKPFAQVAKLLQDTSNFEVMLYYAGHGDFEVQQNKIQACIQEVDKDKYWDYAIEFVDTIYEECYGDVACDLEKSTELMNSLGIDSEAVFECVESQGDTLLDEHYSAAQSVGVTGSPSLVINGVKASVSRTAEAYKQVVCSAFTTAPETCDTELDSTATTTSGSC